MATPEYNAVVDFRHFFTHTLYRSSIFYNIHVLHYGVITEELHLFRISVAYYSRAVRGKMGINTAAVRFSE
jgi:hypothetical protein